MPFLVAVGFWLSGGVGGVFGWLGFSCCGDFLLCLVFWFFLGFLSGPTWNETLEVLKRNLKLAVLFFPNCGAIKLILSRSSLL